MTISQSVGNRGLSDAFWLQVARGQVPGHRAILRTGVNFDLDAGALASIWDRGGLYAYPPAPSLMTLSSASASDAAAGTGARTVRVDGLDANYTEISEVVTLNGTTGVSTVNQYLRCHGVTALTAGSGGAAAGNIYMGTGTITAGVPANVYAMIPVGWGTSQMTPFTVPAGWTAYLVDISVSAIASATNQNTILSIRARQFGGLFIRAGSLVVNGGLAYLGAVVPRGFPERTDIDGVAQTTDSNVIITAQNRFLLVSNTMGEG